MRYLWVIAVVLLLAGSSTADSAVRSPRPPLAPQGPVGLSGSPAIGWLPQKGLGQLLRFIPGGTVELGILVANQSGTLAVTGARVVEPHGTLIHQIGTRFHRWHPPKCPPGVDCPGYGLLMSGGAHRPRPFTLLRGRSVGIELDFRLGSCSEIRSANPAPISRLRVSFHTPHGRTQHRTFTLRRSALDLRMPRPGDCAQPRSSMAINGQSRYQSSSDWTIPGSTGDVCTIRHGSLDFSSREYQIDFERDYSYKHWERVTLHLDHYHGLGAYQGVFTVTTAGGKVWLQRRTRNIEVTKSTPHEVIAIVQAGRLPKGAVRGTMRCRIPRDERR